MAAKQKTDWDAVEPHYRAGIKSLRQLADEFGCTSGRVAQVAKERGWSRDLAAKIKAKAAAKVSRSILSEELSAKKVISENEIVEANAEMQKGITLGHRSDAQRARKLVMAQLEEQEHMTGDRELFAKLGELLDCPDANGDPMVMDKLMDTFHKAMSHPSRVDSTKKLSESLRVLIDLERKVFGIDGDEKGKGDGTVEDAIKRVLAANG